MRPLLPTALLAACGTGACAPPGGDLVILPAPAGAWRTVVGHWEHRVELTGDNVVVPRPAAAYAQASHLGASALGGSGGRREAVRLEWKDLWQAQLRFESRRPLDLRDHVDGSLEFDLEVDDLARGGVRVTVGCGEGCERSVNLIDTARARAGKGWQRTALALRCFARDGADFSKVSLPFALEGTGSGRVSVANVRITREAKPGLPCPDHRTESVTPAMLNEAWALDGWLPRHEQKLAQKAKLLAAGTPPRIVFIGDSITQGWENEGRAVWQRHYAPHHALALGFGGDRTENVLWRLQHGEIDGIAPQVAVLMIGTNNTGHRAESAQTTAAGIKRLLDEVGARLPDTKLLLLAIFPRGEKPDDGLRRINDSVNKIIAGFADGRRIHFLNINADLMNPDGTLSTEILPDLLHLSDKGYAIWQRAMEPTLQKLLNES